MKYEVNRRPDVGQLCDLRESVGYEPFAEDYPRAFERYSATVSAQDGDQLVGWCAVVGDDVRHAFLVDLMVAPTHQRRGVGTELVRRATEEERAKGVTIVHADFDRANEAFYLSCGFEIGLAGVRRIEDS